jgi:hypothetical protein
MRTLVAYRFDPPSLTAVAPATEAALLATGSAMAFPSPSTIMEPKSSPRRYCSVAPGSAVGCASTMGARNA